MNGVQSKMRCPQCEEAFLQPRSLAGTVEPDDRDTLDVHTCERCGGAWVGRAELEAVLSWLRSADLAGRDRLLAQWSEHFKRAVSEPRPERRENNET